MEDARFEIEGQIEENDLLEEYEEEDYGRGPGIYILLVVFIILFLSATSLFVYYQFYLGNGKWEISMKKRTNSGVQINEELKIENERLLTLVDSLEQTVNNKNPGGDSYNEEQKPSASTSSAILPTDLKGTKYEIQIGAFKHYDFSKYDEYLVNMNVDVEDGFNKLVIGRFETFEDACAFRQDLKLVGVSGSFIVKKVDGKRVDFDKWCP